MNEDEKKANLNKPAPKRNKKKNSMPKLLSIVEPVYLNRFRVEFLRIEGSDMRYLEENVKYFNYNVSREIFTFITNKEINIGLSVIAGTNSILPLDLIEKLHKYKSKFDVQLTVVNGEGNPIRVIRFNDCIVKSFTQLNEFSYEEKCIFELDIMLSFKTLKQI